MKLNIDKLLQQAGTSGKYQKTIFLISILIGILTSFGGISLPYIEQSPTVDYTDKNGTTVKSATLTNEICDKAKAIRPVYIPPNSLTAQQGLYCNKQAVSELASFYNLGGLFASFICIMMTEVLGRKQIILISLVIYGLSSIFGVLIPKFDLIVFCWMVMGMFDQIAFGVTQVFLFEIISPEARTWVGTIYNLTYSIAAFILIFLFQSVGTWQVVMGVNVSITVLALLFFVLFAGESPRYFLKTKEQDKAIQEIEYIAKFNGNTVDLYEGVPKTDESSVVQEQTEESRTDSKFGNEIKEMFSSTKIMANFAILSVNMLYSNFSYFTLGLNVKNLSGNIFTNGYYMYGLEFFSYFLCGLAMTSQLLKRKGSYFLFCSISLVISIFSMNIDRKSQTFTVLNVINRAFTNCSWLVVAILNSEIFPSSVRLSASAWTSVVSSIGLIFAPVLVEYFENYIQLTLACLNVLNLCCVLFLEETKDKELAEVDN